MFELKKICYFLIVFFPFFSFGATIEGIINTAKNSVLSPLITVLFILATAVFLWGIIRFLASAGDPKKAAEGRQIMLWGIIGLFVIVAMWGLVEVLKSTFFGTELDTLKIPKTENVPKP